MQEPCAKALRERKLPESNRVREPCAKALRAKAARMRPRARTVCESAERAKAARMRLRARTVCESAERAKADRVREPYETRLVWERVTVCSCQGAKENKNNNVAVAWVTTQRSRNEHPYCNAETAPDSCGAESRASRRSTLDKNN